MLPPKVKPLTLPGAVFTGVLVCLMLSSSLAQASFKQREERWAAQIQESLLDAQALWLTAKQKRKDETFFALYSEAAKGDTKRAVVLLHDAGLHPDWPEVISPLRRGLSEAGWAVLALQMPILPGAAPLTAFGPIFDEAPARLRAGIEFLHGKGIKHITLIGHGVGAAMGAAFLAAEPSNNIDGLVVIGLGAPVAERSVDKLDVRLHGPSLLKQIKLPVLDIYGGLDKKAVTHSAAARSEAARSAGNKDYQQLRFPDADHFFSQYEKGLVEAVLKWLNRLSESAK